MQQHPRYASTGAPPLATQAFGEALQAGGPPALFELCCRYRPYLAELVQQRGAQVLSTLYADSFDVGHSCGPSFVSAAETVAGEIFGESTGHAVAEYFRQTNFVDVGQHHQLHSNPMSFQASLLGVLAAERSTRPFHVVLSCTGIPLGNKTFPAGLEDGPQRYRLFPKVLDERQIYNSPGIPFVYSPPKQEPQRTIPRYFAELLELLKREVPMTDFVTQVSLANRIIWRRLTEGLLPEPLFIPQERVLEGVLRLELQRGRGFIHDLLTRPELYTSFVHGAPGERALSTALFWAVGNRPSTLGKREPLVLVDGELQLRGQVLVSLRAEQLLNYLTTQRDAEYQLLPSLELLYAVMLSQGLACYGGFNQIQYLPEIVARVWPLAQGHESERMAVACARADLFIRGPILLMQDDQFGCQPASVNTFLRAGALPGCVAARSAFSAQSIENALLLAAPEIFDGAIPHTEKQRYPDLQKLGFRDCLQWIAGKR